MIQLPITYKRFTTPSFFISTSVAAFVSSWSIAHGVPITQSLILSVIVVGQSALGASVWQRICRFHVVHPIEAFAAGFVLASTTTTLIDQLLVFWPYRFQSLMLTYLVIGLIAIFSWVNDATYDKSNDSKDFFYVLPLSFMAVPLGVGGGGSWLLAVICFGLATLILNHKNLIDRRVSQFFIVNVTTVLSSLLIFFYRPTFMFKDWRLFRLFTGSDDQFYSEAASNSLVHFGPFDSIFSLDTHVPYHWFTFAWTGSLGHLINADAFTATLHIAAPIGFLYSGLLIWSITFFITQNHFASVTAVIATFAVCSLPEPQRFVYVINTSNVVSHIWLLLSLLILIRFLSSQIRWGIPLLTISSTVALLAKVPYGFVLLVGLGSALLVAVFVKSLTIKQGFATIALLTVCAALSFVLFLRPEAFQDRGFELQFNSANFGLGTRLYPFVPVVIILAIAISRFPYYLIINSKPLQSNGPIIAFVMMSTTISLVRFFVVGGSAENYFLSAGLLFGGLGIGVFWGMNSRRISRQLRIALALVGSSSGLVVLVVASRSTSESIGTAFFVLPVVLGAIGVAGILIVKKPTSAQEFLLISAATFSAITLGAGIGSYLQSTTLNAQIEPGSVVSQSEIESLTWIRTNTEFTDIVATNRNLCANLQGCGYDETRQVIAAFSDRQVLIEGPRFLNGARNYPVWAIERIADSVEFASQPTKNNLQKLRSYGVDWFYLDKTDPRAATNNSFSDLPVRFAFENADTAVIDLRNG